MPQRLLDRLREAHPRAEYAGDVAVAGGRPGWHQRITADGFAAGARSTPGRMLGRAYQKETA